MAATLSLVASILALVGAAEAVGKTLSKARLLYRAPNEILALNNEISDLTAVTKNIESHLLATNPNIVQESTVHLKTLIERARDRVLQLDKLIQQQLLKSGSLDGDYKVFRFKWARLRETVEHHQQALRDAKQNIVMHMLAIDASFQGRTRLIIEEIYATSTQIHDHQLQGSEAIAQQLRQQSQLLHDIQSTQRIAIEHGQEHFIAQSRLLESIVHGATKHSEFPRIESESRQQTYLVGSVPSDTSRTTHNQPMVGIKARVAKCSIARQHRSIWSPICKCSCHTPGTIRTPRLFQKAIGTLFIGYSGYPSAFTKCANEDCQAGFSARVTYTFPFWLLQKMIDVCLASSKLQDPYLTITVRGTTSPFADLFRLTRADDQVGLELLFSSGGARPNDLSQLDELTALYMAVDGGFSNAIKALLRAGADPHHSHPDMGSPYDVAWRLILSNTFDTSYTETLRALFPYQDDYFEDFQFSKLHSIVLGLTPGSLEAELAEPGVNVNATDYRGMTALAWAVRRHDHTSTRLLLRHGAKPDIVDKGGNGPAEKAACWQNVTGLRDLLEAGASVTRRNGNGRNCLHFASWDATLRDSVEILIAAGCDIHEKDFFGSTPLNTAAQTSNSAVVRALLDCGSDINTIDSLGNCPLLSALYEGRDQNLQLLLERGADYSIINNQGSTILHEAALSGGLTTLEILRSAKLSRIDPNAKDYNGKTALQVAQERLTRPEGFINLLLTVLFEIRCRNDAITANRGKDQAVESIEAYRQSEARGNRGNENSLSKGDSETNIVDACKGAGAVERERGEVQDDGESGEAFFDAPEQQ